MSQQYRLLEISGSLRVDAFSTAVLRALTEATASRATYEHADIGAMPHFNQDHFVEPLPPTVQRFREQVTAADRLLVVTPEIIVGLVDKKIVDGRFHDPAVISFALNGFAALFEDIGRFRSR